MINKNKKIFFFITKSNWGGAQKYVFDISTNLPSNDYNITVIMGGEGVLKQRLDAFGVKTMTLGFLNRDVNLINDLKTFIEISKILRKEKPDIIHLNSSKISVIVSIIGRIIGIKKIIFTAHGWAFNEDRSTLSKYIIKFLYFITMIFSHKTIGVSKEIIRQVESWPFIKNKIKLVYPAPIPPAFIEKEKAREFFKDKLNLNIENPIWFSSIGELHPIKGHTYAIQAFKRLRDKRPETDFIYTIIGGGEIKQKLQDEINSLGLEKNIYLTDYLDNASSYLKAFDYYIFPSLSEAFGYALVEAGQAHIPVIASRVGGIPEIVDDKINGLLFESRNIDQLYKNICIYLDDKNTADDYSKKLYEKINNNFSLNTMIKETVEVYK